MPISDADVEHVMSLARLKLPPEQVQKLTRELGAILAHVDLLKSANVSAAQQTASSHPTPMRDDQDVQGLGSKGLDGSAGKDGVFIRVPKIME